MIERIVSPRLADIIEAIERIHQHRYSLAAMER
jgi:hypothetical protein